jgi:hypothetical protein
MSDDLKKVLGLVGLFLLPTLLLVPGVAPGHIGFATPASGTTTDSLSSPVGLTPVVSPAAVPVRAELPNTTGIQVMAAHDGHALASFYYDNSTQELALFTASTNSFTPLQDLGTGAAMVEGIVWAGSEYLVSIYNFTTDLQTFEAYSLHSGLKTVTLPVDPSQLWTFAGTGDGLLFVTGTPGLYALNERTFALERDLTPLLPANATVISAALSGLDLYVGGQTLVSGQYYELYGFIDLLTGAFTQLSPHPAGTSEVSRAVLSVVVNGGKVYFGGMAVVSRGGLHTVGGILVAYDIRTGKLTHLARYLPSRGAVMQLVPVGCTVGVVEASYNLATGTFASGVYVVNRRLSGLINDTTITGTEFFVTAYESSVTNGVLYLGGQDLTTGYSEVEYLPVAMLVP